MQAALRFDSPTPELAGFVAWLNAMQFPHRVNEYNGQLVLWVYQPEHVDWLQHHWQLYCQGLLPAMPPPAAGHPRLAPWIFRYPLTMLLMLLSTGGFLLVFFQLLTPLSWLSFQGFVVTDAGLQMNSSVEWQALLAAGQWWRLLTPMLLHFDLLHLAFNLVFLGLFAHQLERRHGALRLLLLVTGLSLAANLAQYMASPDVLFGGMSGVNYGLLAFCALANRRPGPRYVFPPGLLWLSLLMMGLGFADAFALFGYRIANWAHLGGFVAGLLAAAMLPRR